MSVAFAGLALTHPFTFARCLRRLGHDDFLVYDPDAERVARFADEFGARPIRSLADLAAERPEGAIICGRSSDHLAWARPFTAQGIPTFVDKVLAVTPDDLRDFDRLQRDGSAPVMSTSVLRYGAARDALSRELAHEDHGPVTLARVMVNHSIRAYLAPGNTWQDEPEHGGGTVINMGVHGVEVLVSLFGVPRQVSCHATRRRFLDSKSEDTALLTLAYHDGMLASVEIVSGCDYESSYEIELFAARRRLAAAAPSETGDPLETRGYLGACRAFLEMLATKRSPIPWHETSGVVATLLAARASAASARPEPVAAGRP